MVWTVLDFETTGVVKGWPNEPWQLGLVSVEDGVVLPETKWETLFHVGDRPFSPRAVGRYAEIRDKLSEAPEPMELWPELSSRLVGRPLIAHNCSTERTVLSKLAPMTSFGPWTDTLVYARARYPGLESYALGDLVAAFGLQEEVDRLCPDRTWHDALYDACACAVLAAFFMSGGLSM
jgi:DNA polymerase-3 subunit epsilon